MVRVSLDAPADLPTPQHSPGWTYRLRLWNDLGRAYALRGLPPPLPADLRAATGGAGAQEMPTPAVDQDQHTSLLLMGSDRRSGDGPWRTDSLVWASLDHESGHLALISIPRDLWVSIPGYGSGRINTVDWLGHRQGLPDGELMRRTLELNLGLTVDHFLRLDLQGFVAAVDQLGGLDLAVTCPIEDFFQDPEALGGQQALDLDTGWHHMDGQTALRYVRSRWQSSDFERSRRQQRVLKAAMRQARETDLLRQAPSLYDSLTPYVDTDIGALDVPGLALLALRNADRLETHTAVLGHPATIDWVTPDGAMVLLLDAQRAGQLLDELLSPAHPDEVDGDAEGADESDLAEVEIEILDATGREGWGRVAGALLDDAGLRAGRIETRPAGPESMLFYDPSFETAALEAAHALGLPTTAARPDSAFPGPRPSERPIWIHLAGDWEPCPGR